MGERRTFATAVLILCFVLAAWLLLHSSVRRGLLIGVLTHWAFLAGLFALGLLYGLAARSLKTVTILSVGTALFAALLDEAAMLAAGSAAARTTRLPLSLFIHRLLPVMAGAMVGFLLSMICSTMQRRSRISAAL